jgi:hypothetical protein
VSEAKGTLKQRAFHEVREYFAISLYLFIVFSTFAFYKAMLLAEHNVDLAPHGFALVNALALGKVILIAQDLHLADQFRAAPLIVPTLLKSFACAIVLTCFKFAEETAIGVFHGQSLRASVSVIGGGSWKVILSFSIVLFVVLIPFFGFTELRRVFGEDRLVSAFFRPRQLLNPPPPAP